MWKEGAGGRRKIENNINHRQTQISPDFMGIKNGKKF
jgi:hypothetical protein